MWLGKDARTDAVKAALEEIEKAYADIAMDSFVAGEFGLEDRLSSFMDDGLALRVGSSVFELGSNEGRVYMWLSETLDRFHRADLKRRREHKIPAPKSVEETSRAPRRFEVCDCGTIIKKRRPRSNEYCGECKRADKRWRLQPSAEWPEYVVDAAIIWRDGERFIRRIVACVDCGSEFSYERHTRGGSTRSTCDECGSDPKKQHRYRANKSKGQHESV